MKYVRLGQTGVRISSVALGTANFGTGWGHGSDREEAKRVFDTYAEAGGNFLDTADTYQFGESEKLLSDFLASNREEFFLASKYTFGAGPNDSMLNIGNNRRSMQHCVEASLKRLRTDRLDLYWVHIPDAITPMEEIVRGLDSLVRSGKVLYVGFSDFPAWRIARGLTIADLRGWTVPAAIQLEYSLVERSGERELLPMARALGMAALGWSPLGGGLLTGKYRRGESGRAQGLKTLVHAEDSEQKRLILDSLEQIATETGASMGAIAIAWTLSQGIIPLIGPRSHTQAVDNLAATRLTLTPEHTQRLASVSAIPLGFPHDMAIQHRQRLAGVAPADDPFPIVTVG